MATTPEEINSIAARLAKPSAELLARAAARSNTTPDAIAAVVTKLVAFTAYTYESVNKERRFDNDSQDKFQLSVLDHIFEVSTEFPEALFLWEYRDIQYSYSRKRVIYAGHLLQAAHDDNHNHKAQGIDWVLLDIFAPYRAEYENNKNHNWLDYFDRLEKSIGTNRDTKGLGIIGTAGRCTMGSVDAINGEDGKEVTEFVVTRHELKQLARYWAEVRIEHDYFYFVSTCSGSSQWRWNVYIDRRLDRLTKVLGHEEMQRVWDDAVESYRQCHPEITDENWRVFTSGTEEEREAWRKAVWEEEE